MIADCHIYDRHIPVIKELISRKPYPAPTVKLNPEIKDFYKFTTDDLIVENYETWPQIKNIPHCSYISGMSREHGSICILNDSLYVQQIKTGESSKK